MTVRTRRTFSAALLALTTTTGLAAVITPVTTTTAEATLYRKASPMRMHMASKARGEPGLFSSNARIRAFFLERDRNGAGRA